MVPGSVRNGGGVLAELLRCGHCGRKLKVQHNGLRGVARYVCNDADINHATRRRCIDGHIAEGDAKLTALGWRPRVDLGAGIRQTYAWYRT
jgi:nucleoside-diphosphate-sugar epimerase